MPEARHGMERGSAPRIGERLSLREGHLTVGRIVQDERARGEHPRSRCAVDRVNGTAGAPFELKDEASVPRFGQLKQVGESPQEEPWFRHRSEKGGLGRAEAVAKREYGRGRT